MARQSCCNLVDHARNGSYDCDMGKNPRSKQQRHHDHSYPAVAVRTYADDELFELIDRHDSPPFLLLLDGVQDPHNLGAILRTAAGGGVHAVVAPKDRSVGMTDTVRRISCGGAESVPFVQVTNLSRTIEQLKERNIWTVATSDEADRSLYDVDLTGSIALVMGAEGTGVRRLTAEHCDFHVSLPMSGAVESLNVSVATGICIYEAIRQRRASKK